MARVPDFPDFPPRRRRQRVTSQIIKPEGKFERSSRINIATDRSPKKVTSINPDGMHTILPEMPYIPPA